jgi:hypothetical protein
LIWYYIARLLIPLWSFNIVLIKLRYHAELLIVRPMGELAVPQSLAVYECGDGRSSLSFQIREPSEAALPCASDDLYDYAALPLDTPLTGTLFVRSKATGAVRAIPVAQILQIQRRSRLSDFAPVTDAGTADLVERFGSRAAKRIYNVRQHSVK